MGMTVFEMQEKLDLLKALNIIVDPFGYIFLKDSDKSESHSLLIEDINKKSLIPVYPTNKQVATLALAVYQEERNRYIEQSEIDFVNDALNMCITFDEVQKFNSKYI